VQRYLQGKFGEHLAADVVGFAEVTGDRNP
jgi:hypothetical protein